MHTNQEPLVSVIMIFYNAEVFIRESVLSVINQNYANWELLLVDDGSDDQSIITARNYAEQYPHKIRYLQHQNHQNRGMSASRNLGIDQARGEFICFLDSDDVWKPLKLSEQVTIMQRNPDINLIYGNTVFWWSWDAKNKRKDVVPKMGVKPGVITPPLLIPLFLTVTAAVPAMCSIICRKVLFEKIRFEDSFTGLYEDQAFYYKVCLTEKVYVSEKIWDNYRQHPASACYKAESNGELYSKRIEFLKWLLNYTRIVNIHNWKIDAAIAQELWRNQFLDKQKYHPLFSIIKPAVKLLLRVRLKFLPQSANIILWLRSRTYLSLMSTFHHSEININYQYSSK